MTKWRRGSFQVGIIIAVVMVAIVALAAWLLLRPKAPSPSGKIDAKPIVLAVEVSTVVTPPTGASGNGAADIHEAITEFQRKQEQIETRRRGGAMDVSAEDLADVLDQFWIDQTKAGVLPFKSADKVLAAADKSEFKYYEGFVDPKSLEWRQPARRLTALEWTLKAALLEGRQIKRRGDKEKAEKIFRAVLLVGRRLADDTHVRVWTQIEGLNGQVLAAVELGNLYQETNQVEKAQTALSYSQAADRVFRQVNEKFGMLCQKVNKWDPGDLLLIAADHPDRAWKVEALLALGMARYTAGSAKYKKYIDRQLLKYASESDPWISAAANWSRDLELADYNTQSASGRN